MSDDVYRVLEEAANSIVNSILDPDIDQSSIPKASDLRAIVVSELDRHKFDIYSTIDAENTRIDMIKCVCDRLSDSIHSEEFIDNVLKLLPTSFIDEVCECFDDIMSNSDEWRVNMHLAIDEVGFDENSMRDSLERLDSMS